MQTGGKLAFLCKGIIQDLNAGQVDQRRTSSNISSTANA